MNTAKAQTAEGVDQRAVPAGWQLVPIEPIDAMKTAAGNARSKAIETRDWPKRMWNVTWAAMLAAAPKAPTPDPTPREVIATAYEQGCIDTHNAIQAEPELALMPVENAEFGEAASDYAASIHTPTTAEPAIAELGWAPFMENMKRREAAALAEVERLKELVEAARLIARAEFKPEADDNYKACDWLTYYRSPSVADFRRLSRALASLGGDHGSVDASDGGQ